MDQPLLVSVIIPTLNRQKVLAQTIDSLLMQTYSHFEIILVSQETPVEGYAQNNIRILHLEKANLPRARNEGIKISKGDLILFLDDDIVPSPDLIKYHVETHQKDVAGVVGQILDTHNKGTREKLIEFNEKDGRYLTDWNQKVEQECISAAGGHFSVKRPIFNQLLFDEHFNLTAHWEEVDFAFRLRALGYVIWFQPKATMVHLAVKEGGCRYMNSFLYHYSQFKNWSLFYLKHCRWRNLKYFLIAQKNLLEYQSRLKSGGHDKKLILSCLIGILSAFAVYYKERLLYRHLLPKKRFYQLPPASKPE